MPGRIYFFDFPRQCATLRPMKADLKGVFVCCVALAMNAAAQTPIITSQPQSQTINNASTANFTVVAENAASYQWLFGTNSIDGATSATLTLNDVATNQEGAYSVVVTSSTGGSTNSQPAQLTIIPGTIVQITISKYADGTSSNFLVQLFDHDKPATVENFLHYITSGSYSNMFFDRCIAGFVLQGGDYVSSNRTATNLAGGPVSTGTNIFPSQVDNEFNVGPLIPNTFGTLAMALQSGEPNSATSAFFINLADNSANLDNQNGGFTVFGRILSGTNILQYFNTLPSPTGGIFDLSSTIPTLPVNYNGTNQPTEANLFYCDFLFPTPPPVDTTPPTVSLTFPTPNAVFAPGSPLTVTGTASDNVGLAEVFATLTAITGIYEGQSETNAALGTTDWSVALGILPVGVYQVTAFAQDGAGNLSAPATAYFSNFWQLTIITNVAGQLTTNVQYVEPGEPYSVTATPGAGQVFEDWLNQGVFSVDPVQSFTAETNMTLTVTFVSNSLAPGLAITSPVAGSSVQTSASGDVTISGSVSGSASFPQVTCQLFYQSNSVTAAQAVTFNGLTWSLNESGLVSGPYTIVVVEVDSTGLEGLVTENFTAVVPQSIITSQPQNLTVNAGSTALLSVTANSGATYQWLFGGNPISGATSATLTFEDVATNQAGTYTVVVTSPSGAAFYSQPAQLTVIPGTIVQFAISGYATGGPSNVVVELFDHDKPATVQNFIHYIHSGAYSNLFWSQCVPGYILQGGDYATKDRTSGPPPNLLSINETFTSDLGYSPSFPSQIDNEYGVGPLIHNTFGTIAMQKTAGDPDSAVNVFFFNLADNSTKLDNSNGGYTVFGRVLSGTNILNYFNTFSAATIYDHVNTSGAPTNGLFNSGEAAFNSLPVNYYGVNTPGDSNFFYVDFTFLTPPALDTNPPTIALAYPANGATVTNADVIVSGTAADNVGLAFVYSSVSSPALDDGNPAGGYTIGTTNWSIDVGNLPPGTYSLFAAAQDGAGNISTDVTTSFAVPKYPFNVYTNGPGKLSANLSPAKAVPGSNYAVTAIPAKGALFLNWTSGTNVSIDPTDSFVLPNGYQLTANFIPNTLPGGISFTYPAANAKVGANSIALAGKVAKSSGVTTITAQFFSKTGSAAVTGPMVTQGSSTWSIPPVQLAPGSYMVQAFASNAVGQTTVITEDFTVLAPLAVNITGPGATSIANGTYLEAGATYSIKATPKSGSSFYTWSGPSGMSTDTTISFTMTSGLAVSATFISNTLPGQVSFTYPSPKSQVATNNIMLTGYISPSVNNPQIMCQLFSFSSPASDLQYATVNGTTWSVPLSNVGQGPYTAVAIASDSAGRQTLISETFDVNLYPNVAGTYYGVFFTTNIATNTAGFFKMTVGKTGLLTGTLQFPIYTFPIVNYQIDATGVAELSGLGFNNTEIYFELIFGLTNGADTVTGYVDSLGTVSTFTGYRAVTQLPANIAAGKYVMDLTTISNYAASGPTNDGFGTVTIGSTGTVALAGTLADNTTFSEGVGISKEGIWPVFYPLYSKHGMLIGWETNVIGANGAAGSTGTVYWIKAPTKDTYYTSGLNIEAASTATNYVAPVPGTQYQVVFSGGSLSPGLDNVLTVSKTGQFVPAPGATDKLSIFLSTAGAITGTIYNPADQKTLPIRGAFSSPSLGGSGFVLDPDGQSDPFQIILVP
jgi:cyclophilin family peptidyl-prolyl cis-trans isomerase